MNRVDRLFAILLLLQQKRRLRAQDLAAHFEVAERTIYRDMAALGQSGVPLVALPGEGYEIGPGYFVPPLMLTQGEARALALGAAMIGAHAKGPVASDAALGFAKISAALPSTLRSETEALAGVLRFGAPRVPIDLEDARLQLLQRAIRQHRVVRLDYHGADEPPTLRDVEPERLSWHQEAWYLNAWCRLRGGRRQFRLDRMRALLVRDEHFAPRPADPPAPPTVDARIRFSAAITRFVRERQHYGFVAEHPGPDAAIECTYRVHQVEELHRWLLGWGAQAEPLSPPELRASVRDEATRLAALLT